MQIRLAREEDFAGLCRLWTAVDRLHAELLPGFFRPPVDPPRALPALRQQLRQSDQLLLVAEAGSGLLGLIEGRLVDTPRQAQMVPRRRLYLEDLVVEASWRRRGIAQALLDRAASWGRQHGAVEMLLTVWAGNQVAEAFYQQAGFRTLNRVLARDL